MYRVPFKWITAPNMAIRPAAVQPLLLTFNMSIILNSYRSDVS